MHVNLSVFILAAGLGERLRPITNHIPKPLLPVLGKPMLESVLEKVSALPVAAIGVNLHYKKELIERWIKQSAFSERITLFPEDPVLGTGGALKNAENFLHNSAFLVHNADILSDIDLEKLIAFHKESGSLATLAVHNFPEFNNLVIDENGCLTEIGAMCSLCRAPGSRLVAFTGIAVYAPAFLEVLPEGASSVVHAWTQAISSGQRIGTYDVSGCYWTDIGTPASYAKAVIAELRNNGETVYVHSSVDSCRNIEIDGYTVIEKGSMLGKGLSLRNCIVLPETRIETKESESTEPECFLTLFWGKGPGDNPLTPRGKNGGWSFENCILGPDFTIALNESELFTLTEDNAVLIGTGGSDRRYYRVKRDSRSAVSMQCPKDDPDFQRHIAYTHFFLKNSIPVPEIIEADPDNKTALFEDVGDMSLYSWLKCPWEEDQISEVYRRVLDIAVSIHTTATDHRTECSLLQDRIFDYDHLRWETRYFMERFVEGLREISITKDLMVVEELHTLASKADSFHKTIVHRDFQSQNIMVGKGNVPRLLDYQGARMGPPAYDVASVLWDPYYRIEKNLREQLLHHYIMRMTGNARWFNEQIFRESILPCRLQRHMQALGAYGFLSSVKGKKHFLKYIPEGLRLLREDLFEAKNEYPALDELVKKL
jgi:NDP-sugar pyrophosphorylase family protein/aminoglycoside/choline kinase family phosphotransferase